MATIIPVIVTSDKFLIKKKGKFEFFEYTIEQANDIPNVPFYHRLAKKVEDSMKEFKEVIKNEYNVLLPKPTFAVVLPDDTSDMETTFLQNFFLNTGKAVIVTHISQTLISGVSQYISLSKSNRAIALQYISEGEILAEKYYDSNKYDISQIQNDITRIHIDVDYKSIPIYINNLNLDMEDFALFGQLVNPEAIKRRICDIKIEKL